MDTAGLSIGNAPPPHVPLRYFLTAPVMAMAAGLILVFQGPDVLLSRWMPALLAITHLMTLGFITMVMVGALSQMIPVVAGGSIRWLLPGTTVVHGSLTVGVILLAVGLLWPGPALPLAMLLLGVALALFVGMTGQALWRAPGRGASTRAMQLALLALLVTAVLGLLLTGVRAGLVPLAVPRALVDVHLGWGFVGWVGLLVIGVAYQVVPMFQITPRYPPVLQRWLAPVLLTALLIWAVHPWFAVPGMLVEIVMLAALALFAVMTLSLQAQRRRRLGDTTLQYWRLSMICLLLVIGLRGLMLAGLSFVPDPAVLIGIIVITGVIQSAINGMLFKIVPFLVWLHLRNRGIYRMTMNKVLPTGPMRRQYRLHALAVASLVATAWAPWLTRPAALLFVAATGMLLWQLVGALRFYRAKIRA